MRLRTISTALMALALLTHCASRSAYGQAETQPAPETVERPPVHRPRYVLIGVGGGTFSVSYGLALLTGAVLAGAPDCGCKKEGELFVIPVAGPWLANASAPRGSRDVMWPFVAWSAIQAAALTMLAIGLVGHDVPARRPTAGPTTTVLPTVTGHSAALSLNVNW